MTHLEYIQFSHFLPEIFDEGEEPATPEIPYGFIMNVLEMRANTTDQLRSWTIRRSILHQALKHVDPGRVGMAITIVRCMTKRADGKVYSLREFEGLGTPPWGGDLEEKEGLHTGLVLSLDASPQRPMSKFIRVCPCAQIL